MPWTIQQSAPRHVRYGHSAVAANATNSSDAIAVAGLKTLTIQVAHASHSDTSTWSVQSRNDGTNWDTIAGTSTTTAGASGTTSLVIHPISFQEIRLTITEADANASATLTPTFVANKM